MKRLDANVVLDGLPRGPFRSLLFAGGGALLLAGVPAPLPVARPASGE